jgi:predicted NAD-dependent protein-ADP-ribosyltransferase YbiA (DUF1768 family)
MEFVYFGSGTSLKELSNFYNCEISYKGNLYNSVEHVYVSLKFIETDRIRFQKNSDLGDFNAFERYKDIFYPKTVDISKKINYWKSRRCVGIVAKMCGNPKNAKKLGLTFTMDLVAKEELMMEILKIKFENIEFKKILKQTGNKILVEFKRNFIKNEKEYWGGYVVDNIIYGNNKMGSLLMELRKNI